MNIIEESFQTKEEKSKKMTSKIILGAIILLIILIIGITSYLMYIKNSQLKLTLDGQVNEKFKDMLIIENDGTIYIPIKEVAGILGYDSYNGEYSDKSEEQSKCYIQNENEVANFSLGSNKIYKLDLTTSTENYEYVYSKKPVKAINRSIICNIRNNWTSV